MDRNTENKGRGGLGDSHMVEIFIYLLFIYLWRRRGSAVECWTLERESPGSNPLHMMAPLMATRCGDNKAKSL